MREELKQAIIKKAATEYAELPVQHSNALQGAVADQLAKGPRTIKRLALGGGLGLLAGLAGAGFKSNSNAVTPDEVGAMVLGGGKLGIGVAGAYDALNRIWELRNDIQAYRAAEKKQTGSDKAEDKADTKEVKTAAVNAIINKVLK